MVKQENKSKGECALPIIFMHKGDSFYLKYALLSAKKYNPDSRIILIGENVTQYPKFVEYHKMSDYDTYAARFRSKYIHIHDTALEIERFCFERWLIASSFIKKNKIERCLIVDSDVLLYKNITEDAGKFEKFDFTLANRSSGGLMFVNGANALEGLADFIYKSYSKPISAENLKGLLSEKNGITGINDVILLRQYCKKHSARIGEISDIINNETYDVGILSEQGFEMADGMKRVVFVKGLPFCKLKSSGELVKMCCLHFMGGTKFYMKYFYKGHYGFFENHWVKTLMYLRNKLSPKLSNSMRKRAKNMLSALGF